ncbi:transposase [Aeromonas veronii]|uniref:transposase n=1 Tax=Aeromonas veronii TaxID=654 RepID=UPI00386468AA
MFGEGDWKVRKHGSEKRRVWRKLHLVVDPATHNIVAAEVSLENVHDAEELPTLLNPLRRKLGRVYEDDAYDTAKPAISLSRAKGRQPVSRLARTRDSGKRGTQEMRPCW